MTQPHCELVELHEHVYVIVAMDVIVTSTQESSLAASHVAVVPAATCPGHAGRTAEPAVQAKKPETQLQSYVAR